MDLVRSLRHPQEVCALVKYKINSSTFVSSAAAGKSNQVNMSEGMQTCYNYLKLTSRSFAAVIQSLDDELRDAVCIFYLVLRALDTVEDDMSISTDTKIPMLERFYKNLEDPSWKYLNSAEKDHIVLEDFPVISGEYRLLKHLYRDVIADICQRMGAGMTIFLTRSPDSIREWDEYCHYVAGLVGIGLSRIFSASGLEDHSVGESIDLSNSMGLFLQKTNIIRDFLEDVLQERKFWPREVWGRQCSEPIELCKVERRADALVCLNELVTNALTHVPDVLQYLSQINNRSVFNFCAIPQVMAIATLERCYNNESVFEGVVKIRRGETVRLMQQATNIENVKSIFVHFIKKIQVRVPQSDHVSSSQTRHVLDVAMSVSRTDRVYHVSTVGFLPLYVSVSLLVVAILWHFWTTFVRVIQDDDVDLLHA